MVAQHINLLRFVSNHTIEYEALKYHPWTKPSSRKQHAECKQSTHFPSLQGVFPIDANKEFKPKDYVCTYHGLIMTSEMHDKFDSLFHCPTAIEAKCLDYLETDAGKARDLGINTISTPPSAGGWNIRIVIVGDP